MQLKKAGQTESRPSTRSDGTAAKQCGLVRRRQGSEDHVWRSLWECRGVRRREGAEGGRGEGGKGL